MKYTKLFAINWPDKVLSVEPDWEYPPLVDMLPELSIWNWLVAPTVNRSFGTVSPPTLIFPFAAILILSLAPPVSKVISAVSPTLPLVSALILNSSVPAPSTYCISPPLPVGL